MPRRTAASVRPPWLATFGVRHSLGVAATKPQNGLDTARPDYRAPRRGPASAGSTGTVVECNQADRKGADERSLSGRLWPRRSP